MKKLISITVLLFSISQTSAGVFHQTDNILSREWCKGNKLMGYENGRVVVIDDCSRLGGVCVEYSATEADCRGER